MSGERESKEAHNKINESKNEGIMTGEGYIWIKKGMGGKNYPGDEQRKMEKRCWEKRENFKGRRGGESGDRVKEVSKRSVRDGGGDDRCS